MKINMNILSSKIYGPFTGALKHKIAISSKIVLIIMNEFKQFREKISLKKTASVISSGK
jgi:hypothetical protein